MRVFYISEVQWLSQVSRKHQLVRRFPGDWDVVFVSPINTRAGENSFRMRRDPRYAHVRYASVPLPKPDSRLAPVRAMTKPLSLSGLHTLGSMARSLRPHAVVCSYIWAAPLVARLTASGVPVLYDCNDLHTEFYPACPDAAERVFRELIASASEVVASSRRLREVCGRGVVIGNGVDLETFAGSRPGSLPRALAEGRLNGCERLVCYVGSVDDRVDFDILETLVAEVGDFSPRTGVVCIGRVFDGARGKVEALSARHPENVLFTGRIPYEELPRYMSHASVGIAPFVLDERTRAINPNKLYTYAAMEQNIVSTPFSDEIVDHADLVYTATGPGAFTAAVKEALGDDERRRAVRERIAVPNGWNEKAGAFVELLSNLAGGRPPEE